MEHLLFTMWVKSKTAHHEIFKIHEKEPAVKGIRRPRFTIKHDLLRYPARGLPAFSGAGGDQGWQASSLVPAAYLNDRLGPLDFAS